MRQWLQVGTAREGLKFNANPLFKEGLKAVSTSVWLQALDASDTPTLLATLALETSGHPVELPLRPNCERARSPAR